jgi:hypothetical protein
LTARGVLLALAATLVSPLPGPVAAAPTDVPARDVEPVVLTGLQLPEWSRLPAEGVANPYPSGSGQTDTTRDAHNGQVTVPPDARAGVPVEQVTAFAWRGDASDGGFEEIPVQVDERFPYFLANANSDFAFYSGTDKELSYEWDEEAWLKTEGRCEVRYPEGVTATEDPVTTFDDDDEVVFMASDAGTQAPLDASGPEGSTEERQEIRLLDPHDPTAERFVYLFLREQGSSFDRDNGYVHYDKDTDADEWIDRNSFSDSDPEKIGSSNTGYGPNLPGTVCNDDPDTPEVEAERSSSDRFPRDGVTVTTDTYRWRATGRWMVRNMHVTAPGEKGAYGPDLIDRWKGRAFQQSPDSSVSLVGFEDEQVNWEANSVLLGELAGPVRAVREVWGADSGTNVTKTESFYRDAITYRYRVRVHPIPPDGLYTSWDYNHDQVGTYYNESLADGVPIDGINDEAVGNIDEAPTGEPAFFDAPDPTFTKPLAFLNWEQVSGKNDNGSLVYLFEAKNAQAFENPLVVPYYRDDACLDDGTGDDPSVRAWPGDSYNDLQNKAGGPEYTARPCFTDEGAGEGPYRQGAFGQHGVHYFFTNDTDNAFGPVPLTEIDGQQWQWAVPTEAPTNLGDRYANTVKTPLLAVTSMQASTPGDQEPSEQPTSVEYIGATSGQTTDSVTLAARLIDIDGPVEGKSLNFSLGGEDQGSAITDEDGVAVLTPTLTGPARSVEVTAAFAGDGSHAPSSSTTAFEVLHEDSATDLVLTGAKGKVRADARLYDMDDEGAVAGRTIRFLVNDTEVGTDTTDGSGVATIELRANQARPGDTISAVFDGDDTFLGSEASGTAPAPGA